MVDSLMLEMLYENVPLYLNYSDYSKNAVAYIGGERDSFKFGPYSRSDVYDSLVF